MGDLVQQFGDERLVSDAELLRLSFDLMQVFVVHADIQHRILFPASHGLRDLLEVYRGDVLILPCTKVSSMPLSCFVSLIRFIPTPPSWTSWCTSGSETGGGLILPRLPPA